jgi:tellurite resistance protein
MPGPISLEHFRNLISLAAADGKIDEIEKAALSKIAYEQGIPLDRFNVMLQKAHEYKFLIPQNQEEKELQLGQMIAVAMVDGEFAPAELDLIKMVAQKLGFSTDEFKAILEKYK